MLDDFLTTSMDFSILRLRFGSYQAFSGLTDLGEHLSKIYLQICALSFVSRYESKRECDETVQILGLTILILLTVEVVPHFLNFIIKLFKNPRQTEKADQNTGIEMKEKVVTNKKKLQNLRARVKGKDFLPAVAEVFK